MTLRTQKIAELLRSEISAILLRKARDKRIGFVSITNVEVTADLAEAFVYVSIFGTPLEKELGMKGLRSAAKYIRVELGKVLTFYTTPRIIFKEDDSLEKGSKIIAKLNALNIKKD